MSPAAPKPAAGRAAPPRGDDRMFGHHYRRPAWVVGLLVVVVLLVGVYLAFTKQIPFTGPGYELHATFENAATLRSTAPVRIAGVNVGKVTDVSSEGEAVDVTFTVDEQGQPIHEDAQIEIRPRLFLEGNFFLEVRPGSPSAPNLEAGATIPVTQTSTAVQLDQVLTGLQAGSREDLQLLLEGYGTGLTYEPTAEDDRTQDPDVHGETGAESINDSFAYGGRAGRTTAIVNEALRGQKPHDLSDLIRGQRDVFTKLSGSEASLKGLITNFNVTTGALASESANLSATIRELAPTLEQADLSLRNLSAALPFVRAWGDALEPGLRELPATIAASGPWLNQVGLLLRDPELGDLAKLLASSSQPLAQASAPTEALFGELTKLNRCVTDVLDPTGEFRLPYAEDPDADPSNNPPNFNELFYGAANQAGEGASFDGNGSYLRVQAGGGDELVGSTYPDPTIENTKIFGKTIEAPIGTQPRVPTTGRPPFKTGVPCHQNAPPDLDGPLSVPGPPSPIVGGP